MIMRDCSFSVTVLWSNCAILFCKIMSQKQRTRKLRVFKVTNHLGMDAKMKVFSKRKTQNWYFVFVLVGPQRKTKYKTYFWLPGRFWGAHSIKLGGHKNRLHKNNFLLLGRYVVMSMRMRNVLWLLLTRTSWNCEVKPEYVKRLRDSKQ
jgi:hypothetical protein